MENCLECAYKYLDTTDGTDIVYVCAKTDKVLAPYTTFGECLLEFKSCLNFKSYEEVGCYFEKQPIITQLDEDLPF